MAAWKAAKDPSVAAPPDAQNSQDAALDANQSHTVAEVHNAAAAPSSNTTEVPE
jgi:hypothetical protein